MSVPTNDGPTGAWSRADRIAALALLVAVGVSLYWTVHPWYDPATDAALYVSTARSVAAGDGYTYLGAPFVVRPPGFSFLLAPLVGATAPPAFGPLNALVAGFGAVAALGAFALTRRRLGGPLAALLALALWLNPGVQRLSSQVLSDVPGLALLVLGLVVDRAARRRGGLGLHALLGLTLTAAVYLRTLNLLLVPAIACDRLLGKRRADEARARLPLALALALPIAALVPWIVRSASIDVPTPTEQVYLHSYVTAQLHADPGDPSSPRLSPGEHARRSVEQSRQVVTELGNRLGAGDSTPIAYATAAALLALGLLAWFRRRDTATWLLLGLGVVLGTYFAFKPRLVLPLWFLSALLAVETLHELGARLAPRRAVRAVLALLLAAVAVVDFDPWSWRAELETAHAELARVGQRLDALVHEDASAAAPIGHDVGLFTNRPVYSLQIVAERQGPAAAIGLLERYGVTHVVQDRRRPLGWSFDRLGFVPEPVGPFTIWRGP